MKFLLDDCLSTRLSPLLTEAGNDVVHVVDRDLAGRVDDEVLAAALHEGRVLMSADTDFGEILAKEGLALPSLVLFRQSNRGPEHQAATLLDNLDQIAHNLDDGAIVVFTIDNIRPVPLAGRGRHSTATLSAQRAPLPLWSRSA